MTESSDLYRDAIKAIGAKKVSSALNLSLSQTYRLQRPTMDEDADSTGARSDADRIEMLVDVMAAHPHARPAIVRWKLWFERLFDRALNRTERRQMCPETWMHELGQAVREFGEFLEHASARKDQERILVEGTEAIAKIRELIHVLDEGLVEGTERGDGPKSLQPRPIVKRA